MALDRDLSCRWCSVSRQTLERGRLASTIDTQQGKALAIVKGKRCLFDSSDWCATERIIFLLEVVHPDAIKVCGIDHGSSRVSFIINIFNFWMLAGRGYLIASPEDRVRRCLARYHLHGYSILFCDHIVVLDHFGTLPVRAARLPADPWAPVEILVDLELDQGKEEDADEEVSDQDDTIAFQVVPRPDLGRDLSRDNLPIVSRILSPRLHEKGARGRE